MTSLYFVRHAQPDYRTGENSTYGLSDEGMIDRMVAVRALEGIQLDTAVSSPYRRSLMTIEPIIQERSLTLKTDIRLRERDSAIKGNSSFELFRSRWNDFDFHEPGGESLGETQVRNIVAIEDILSENDGRSVLVGTHGTSLCTILNYYDRSLGFDFFMRIINFMPYVIKVDFEGISFKGMQELAFVEKEIHGQK